jgi:very-short-patch-repair endonuclease
MPRGQHFTREFQQAARRKVSSESCAANGRKGYRATMLRHGQEPAFKAARQHRLATPSQPELTMIGILSTLGLECEREFRLGDSFYTVDFKLTHSNKVIEVHGKVHRTLDVEKRAHIDAKKRELMMQAGLEWIYVTDIELLDVAAVSARIANYAGTQTFPLQIPMIEPNPDCAYCLGKGYYRDSIGDEPIVKYEYVDCECRWRHLKAAEAVSEEVLF